MSVLVAFLEAAVRTATPLLLAALGETVVQRAGLINIGLEGAIIAGAFGAIALGVGADGGVWGGFGGAILGGAATAAILAWFTLRLRADQIITGTAITLLSLGTTGFLYRVGFGEAGAALAAPTLAPVAIPGLASLPVVGRALFTHPVTTYIAIAGVPLLAWWLARTRAGLALRAVGESPEAAIAAGVSPARLRWWAVLFGGAMGGLAGGTLVLAQVGTFAEGMSAGRGFIAIAIVALGRWSPLGVAAAALLFGATSALQFLLQAGGWRAPYQLFLALPYALTLVALAGIGRGGRAPAALGRPDAAAE